MGSQRGCTTPARRRLLTLFRTPPLVHNSRTEIVLPRIPKQALRLRRLQADSACEDDPQLTPELRMDMAPQNNASFGRELALFRAVNDSAHYLILIRPQRSAGKVTGHSRDRFAACRSQRDFQAQSLRSNQSSGPFPIFPSTLRWSISEPLKLRWFRPIRNNVTRSGTFCRDSKTIQEDIDV